MTTKQPLLRPTKPENDCSDYELTASTSVWILWKGYSISILPCEFGINIDVFPAGREADEEVASLSVTDTDLEDFISLIDDTDEDGVSVDGGAGLDDDDY